MKNKLATFFFITFSIFFISCGRSKKNKQVFHYNEQTAISSLDPAFAKNQSLMWPAHQLFNTLVEVGDTLNIKPSVAKSWSISQDKKTYTFILRSDIYFHNNNCFPLGKGRKLAAQDVVYSLLRIVDKKVASPGAWIFNHKIDSTEPFKAINDTTFQLKLSRPYSPILGILSMQYCSIVPKEAVDYYGNNFRSNPVGTGPFYMLTWQEGQGLILRKNPQYFERDSLGVRLPYIEGISVSFYDSKATEFLLFRQGKLEFINDIDASFKDEILTKKGDLRQQWLHKIILHKHPYLNIEYAGILLDKTSSVVSNSPLQDKRVRQAINYGFDRTKMMLYLRNSIGMPASAGFIPRGLPAFDTSVVKGYNYNPQKSKQLLQEAGYGNTKPVTGITFYTIAIYADLASYVARALQEVGVQIQVEVVQKSLLLEMMSSGKAPFFRGSWIADYPDEENYLSVFYSKNPAPPNYTRYKNAAFDALFEKAVEETNRVKQLQLYRQADQLLIQDAPIVPMWYDEVIHLVQPYVTDFKPNALNLLELRHTKLH